MPSIPVSFGQMELGSNRTNGVGRVWMLLSNAMFRAPWSVAVDRKRTLTSSGSDDRIAEMLLKKSARVFSWLDKGVLPG